ncbi:uncharacterized protein LOC126738850 [Anthonomus grandis grandis]|uniref:uncharacterized protein LOC126738850 n=1 Tax=Anthonomus grandis grandis TaxID=2921223 RepID=UPI002165B845|nr:uncharacterized protein LOC126738850 [Anthonomus grandis grandis]
MKVLGLIVFCLFVLFDRGFCYGIRQQYDSHTPDEDVRKIKENLPNLLFLKQLITSELNKKYNNFEYDDFHSQNKLQPHHHHHIPSYTSNDRPDFNENYEIYPQNFENKGHNHNNHPSFQNGKYDVIGPFPVDFGPGFQHSEEYHRKIGDKKFFPKTEKPQNEYAVIEIYEQPDLPNPNVKYVVTSTRKPKLDESTTQRSISITASTELNVQEHQYPCFDTRSKQTESSPSFHSADCLGFPRGRPRPPPPPPRPSTTVAPISIDPRASTVSFVTSSPKIDIRSKMSDVDSIVFPDD